MSDSTNAILQRAYELIEDGALELAQETLSPLLESDADNPTLWWVYSHAVRDPSIGRAALDRVLELDSTYPGARELNTDVLAAQSPPAELVDAADSDGSIAQSQSDFDIDDWEALQPLVTEEPAAKKSRLAYFVVLVVLGIFVAGAALVATGALDFSAVLSRLLPSPEAAAIVVAAPTGAANATVAAESTDGAVATSMVEATEATGAETAIPGDSATELQPTSALTLEATAAATEEATVIAPGDGAADTSTQAAPVTDAVEPDVTPSEVDPAVLALVDAVAQAISEFSIDPRSSDVLASELGSTLIIQVCAVPGREFNARLNLVMDALVGAVAQIPSDIEAVAAGLLNCDDPEAVLRIIAVPVSVIQRFAAEEIEAKDFQRAWQPLY